MEKERLQYIDIAKGICILIVVTSHILLFNFTGSGCFTAKSFISSFQMPVFMLLSGYVAALSHRQIDGKYALNFVWKKFRSLAIPYYVWGLFLTPFALMQLPLSDFLSTAKRLLLEPNSGAWFIIVLFCYQLYFLLFRSLADRMRKYYALGADIVASVIVIAILFVVSKDLPGGVKLYFTLRYFLFFILGYFYQRYAQKVVFSKWTLLLSLIAFIISVKGFKDGRNQVPLQIVISLFASVIVLNVARALESVLVSKSDKAIAWLERIGKKSLVIYLTHYALIVVLQKELIPTDNIHAIPLFFFCGFCAVVTSMLLTKWGEWIEQIPLLDTLLYGHTNKQKDAGKSPADSKN